MLPSFKQIQITPISNGYLLTVIDTNGSTTVHFPDPTTLWDFMLDFRNQAEYRPPAADHKKKSGFAGAEPQII